MEWASIVSLSKTSDPCYVYDAVFMAILAQGPLSRGIDGGESAEHSLPPPTIPVARDSTSQPLGYEFNSLTIRPRLPQLDCKYAIECLKTLHSVHS